MTKRVTQLIDDIRIKYKDLHNMLLVERKKSESFESEIGLFKAEIEQLNEKNRQLANNVEDLKMELEATLQQEKESIHETVENRDEEIDELVREIEHCISQLKQ